MSRVPVWWSMMPTTMNSAALNRAWPKIIATPAVVASGVPTPNRTSRKPSWLTVPNASRSLRSYWRRARRAASTIVVTPAITTIARQVLFSPNAGENRPAR